MNKLLKCKYCFNTFNNVSSLNYHKKHNKKCLEIQDKLNIASKYICSECNKEFTYKSSYIKHEKICKSKKDNKINELETRVDNLKKEIEQNKVKRLENELYKKNKEIEQSSNKINIIDLSDISQIYLKDRENLQNEEQNEEQNETEQNKIEQNETEQKENKISLPNILNIKKVEQEGKKDIILKDNQLILSNVIIDFRSSDGKINLTQLCKAGNKEYKAWFRTDKTQSFLKALSLSVNISTDRLLTYEDHGPNNRNTWGHPQVAINIAQWISADFDVQVSKWIFELMTTGKVELGKEKSNEELDKKWKEILEEKNKEIQTLKQQNYDSLCKVNTLLQKHSYPKFNNNSPCVYIISSGHEYKDGIERYKFGIAGTKDSVTKKNENEEENELDDEETNIEYEEYNNTNKYKYGIDKRLESHRTLWPQMELIYLVYTENAKLIENNMKIIFKKYINPTGHELVEHKTKEELINVLVQQLDNLNKYQTNPYKIENNIEHYNMFIKSTIKKY